MGGLNTSSVAFSGLQKKCGEPFLTSDRDLAPTFNNTSMVKAYLRYEPTASFGVINSTLSNIIYDATGKLAIAPALEQVILWDLKKGTKVRTLLPTQCSFNRQIVD